MNDNNRKTEEAKPSSAVSTVRSIYEWVELLALSVCFVLLILVLIGRHSPVDGESMINTLQNKDLLIVSDLFYKPRQGDVIVFENKETGYNKPYVKRIIATEGQTIYINENEKTVYVNGEALDEPYAYYSTEYGFTKGSFFADKSNYTLKEGEVFVMGDNRCNSRDSRMIGPVDVRSIVGRVVLRVYPFNAFGKVN